MEFVDEYSGGDFGGTLAGSIAAGDEMTLLADIVEVTY